MRVFYGEALGLRELAPRPQGGGALQYRFLLGAAVRGVGALCRELEARGARIAMRPRELGGIVRIMFVEDPNGNWIEFGEPL